MSQDLFAAFGDSPPAQAISQNDEFGDDDWGDFENATTSFKSSDPGVEPSTSLATAVDRPLTSRPNSSSFLPKAQKRNEPAMVQPEPTTGRHPFADHMDMLFSAGDDEYDAGADDLENLATNPEAAMAYSKRIIAEQEARALRESNFAGSLTRQAENSRKSYPPSNSAAPHGKSTVQLNVKLRGKPSASADQPAARNKLQKKSGYAPAKDPDVLFDADNISDSESAEDDDFGSFLGSSTVPDVKTTAIAAKPSVTMASLPDLDLLGLGDTVDLSHKNDDRHNIPRQIQEAIVESHNPTPSSWTTKSLLPGDENPWANSTAEVVTHAQLPTPVLDNNRSHLNIDATHDDAGWGDFDDFEPSEPNSKVKTVPPASSPQDRTWQNPATANHAPSASNTGQETGVPPTNVPPPVLLLSIFPAAFASAQDTLFGPIAKLDSTQRQQLLGHAATHQFLRGYLNQAIVLAHIIAGRKLRWKRDQILSQSMRIGPAAAGGKSGMKLTGIDKSEVAKEDREVLDAVRLWKAQIGKLRGAVTGALAATKLPAVPEISEQMPVKVLKAVDGGFVAPHACALCGLKREERVAKVDIDVDDSFGEWWVKGMDMHVMCKTWWEENRKKLQSR